MDDNEIRRMVEGMGFHPVHRIWRGAKGPRFTADVDGTAVLASHSGAAATGPLRRIAVNACVRTVVEAGPDDCALELEYGSWPEADSDEAKVAMAFDEYVEQLLRRAVEKIGGTP